MMKLLCLENIGNLLKNREVSCLLNVRGFVNHNDPNQKNASQDADSFGTNICVCYNSLNSLTLPPNPHQFPHVIYKTKRKFMNFIANVRHYITDNIIFYKGEEPFSRVLLNCTVTVQCV